jgi:hypothetical protein
MEKQIDKNSATAALASFADVLNDAIPPPAGVRLIKENEHLIWVKLA